MLRLRAPAKINWTLEVLGRRPDGYHELRTILQTIDLCDEILLEAAPPGAAARRSSIQLHIPGVHLLQTEIAGESNLAYRAAKALQEETGRSEGVSITLRKRIPVAVAGRRQQQRRRRSPRPRPSLEAECPSQRPPCHSRPPGVGRALLPLRWYGPGQRSG